MNRAEPHVGNLQIAKLGDQDVWAVQRHDVIVAYCTTKETALRLTGAMTHAWELLEVCEAAFHMTEALLAERPSLTATRRGSTTVGNHRAALASVLEKVRKGGAA